MTGKVKQFYIKGTLRLFRSFINIDNFFLLNLYSKYCVKIHKKSFCKSIRSYYFLEIKELVSLRTCLALRATLAFSALFSVVSSVRMEANSSVKPASFLHMWSYRIQISKHYHSLQRNNYWQVITHTMCIIHATISLILKQVLH